MRPILGQIAWDRSNVSLRSQQYGLSDTVVVVGRISRRMVVVAILVAVRNFKMFKNPYCDYPIAVHLVCCLSALTQLVLWSQYDLRALSVVALLLYSVWARSTVVRVYCSDENKTIRIAKCDAFSGVCESIQ